MGLQEGQSRLSEEGGRKGRKGIHNGQVPKGNANGFLQGRNEPQPFPAVFQEEFLPAVKHGGRDEEGGADAGNRFCPQEVFSKHPEDEEQAVGTVRDEGIWKDCMGVSAGADDAGNPDAGADRPAINEVHDKAVIVSVNTATSLTATGRTNLPFGNKLPHAGFKKGIR